MEWVGIPSQVLDLDNRWMYVISFTSRPLCPFEGGWRLQPVRTMKKIQIYLVPAGNRTPITRLYTMPPSRHNKRSLLPRLMNITVSNNKTNEETQHGYVELLFISFTSPHSTSYCLSYIFVSISLILSFLIPVCYITYRKMPRSKRTASISQIHDRHSCLAICLSRTCRTLHRTPSFSVGRITSNETLLRCTSTANELPTRPPTRFFSFPACLFKFDR